MGATVETESTSLSVELLAWIAEAAGGHVVHADRRPGGGRREAWVVDVEAPDGNLLPLFLRYDRSDADETGDPFTLHREAQFYFALMDSSVPVPRVLAVHPREQAILLTRERGQTWFSQLRDEDQRLSVARDFMRILAELHKVDPGALELPGRESDAPPGQDCDTDLRVIVHREIDTWEALYRRGGELADPLIEWGLTWLRRHVPDVTGPVVIVQGDTGPGNFLYENGRVTAVLDWELGHLGDPHDDLGWLALRAVQEPFTHLPDRLADYTAAGGCEVDFDRVRYYRVFAELRVLVLERARRYRPDPLGEVGNSLIYGTLHRRLFIEAVADVLGLTLDEGTVIEAEPTDRQWLYDAALAQIRQIIVPRSRDPFVIQRSKGLARILKYLREADRLADAVAEHDLDDTAAVLGERPTSMSEGEARLVDAVRAGKVTDKAVVRLVHRQVVRQTQLLRPAMGVLADRHFDELPRGGSPA